MITRRATFALPIALPFAMAAKPERSTTWTPEEIESESAAWQERARDEAFAAQEFHSGCCAGWVEAYDVEHDVGYLKCFDDRLAFFHKTFSDYDPTLMARGSKVFVYWREKPGSSRTAHIIQRWVEA